MIRFGGDSEAVADCFDVDAAPASPPSVISSEWRQLAGGATQLFAYWAKSTWNPNGKGPSEALVIMTSTRRRR